MQGHLSGMLQCRQALIRIVTVHGHFTVWHSSGMLGCMDMGIRKAYNWTDLRVQRIAAEESEPTLYESLHHCGGRGQGVHQQQRVRKPQRVLRVVIGALNICKGTATTVHRKPLTFAHLKQLYIAGPQHLHIYIKKCASVTLNAIYTFTATTVHWGP